MSALPADKTEQPPLPIRRPAPRRGRIYYVKSFENPNGMNVPTLGMDRVLEHAGLPLIRLHRSHHLNLIARALGRYKQNRQLVRVPGKAILTVLGWPNDARSWPFCYWREMIPWIFDCWPRDYHKWEHLFRRHRTRLAFFSARGSAEHFQKALPQMESIWIPEACMPDEYSPSRPLAQRSIHVLEIGRKHDAFHAAIAPRVAASGYNHIFSRQGTQQMLFPTQRELLDALADSAISICFPRSITHPDLAGGLETVTLRYFESIASGCLLLGKAPRELIDLFGYNPVIEVDLADPWPEVEPILADLPAHQAMVAQNLARLHEVGTYTARGRDILRALQDRGWDIGPAASTLSP